MCLHAYPLSLSCLKYFSFSATNWNMNTFQTFPASNIISSSYFSFNLWVISFSIFNMFLNSQAYWEFKFSISCGFFGDYYFYEISSLNFFKAWFLADVLSVLSVCRGGVFNSRIIIPLLLGRHSCELWIAAFSVFARILIN